MRTLRLALAVRILGTAGTNKTFRLEDIREIFTERVLSTHLSSDERGGDSPGLRHTSWFWVPCQRSSLGVTDNTLPISRFSMRSLGHRYRQNDDDVVTASLPHSTPSLVAAQVYAAARRTVFPVAETDAVAKPNCQDCSHPQ